MSEQSQDITPELIELGVAIAIGAAGLQISGDAPQEAISAVQALWPEELSADALSVSEQVVMALFAWLTSSDVSTATLSAGDLLAFSQSLLPTNE